MDGQDFKIFRWLRPVAWLYGVGVELRNKLFDWGWLRSESFSLPVICVGNLAVGGTGKTPHTEYLIRLLAPGFSLGVVSRGYGRQDRHNLLVQEGMTARQTGDEPLQYFLKFNELIPKRFAVYLATKRVEGIRELKQLRPDCQIVLLDDAYQHRHVKAGLNILLTEYGKPFFKDHLLPWGNLRESRKQSKRAQIIVVTKCPENLDEAGKRAFLEECPLLPGQDIFFSKIAYDPLQFVQNPLSSNQPDTALQVAPVLTDEPTSPGKIGNGNRYVFPKAGAAQSGTERIRPQPHECDRGGNPKDTGIFQRTADQKADCTVGGDLSRALPGGAVLHL